jgi:hypothetical protein
MYQEAHWGAHLGGCLWRLCEFVRVQESASTVGAPGGATLPDDRGLSWAV